MSTALCGFQGLLASIIITLGWVTVAGAAGEGEWFSQSHRDSLGPGFLPALRERSMEWACKSA